MISSWWLCEEVCELSGEGPRQDTMGRVTLKVAGVDAAATKEGAGVTTGELEQFLGCVLQRVVPPGSGQWLSPYLLFQMKIMQ